MSGLTDNPPSVNPEASAPPADITEDMPVSKAAVVSAATNSAKVAWWWNAISLVFSSLGLVIMIILLLIVLLGGGTENDIAQAGLAALTVAVGIYGLTVLTQYKSYHCLSGCIKEGTC